MGNTPDLRAHLPLSVPVHQILLSVADDVRHGYAIIQDIRQRTNGEVELTASTLYGALSRMLSEGMILEVDTPVPAPDDHHSRRRYYRISPFGRSVAQAEAGRLTRTLAQASRRGLGPEASPAAGGAA